MLEYFFTCESGPFADGRGVVRPLQLSPRVTGLNQRQFFYDNSTLSSIKWKVECNIVSHFNDCSRIVWWSLVHAVIFFVMGSYT